MKFRNDAGRSMVELLLYLSVIFGLTAGTLKMYSDSVERTRMLQFDTQVMDIVEKVNLYYLGRDFPSNVREVNAVLKKNLGSDINFFDPWGGEIVVTARNSDTSNVGIDKPHMDLQVSNLDTKRCIDVANKFVEKSAVFLLINSQKADLNITDIADICSSKSGDDNIVQGFFMKD